MGVIDLASNKSLWRGVDYYENNRVMDWEKVSEDRYLGQVKGSSSSIYQVEMEPSHPRKSSCTCPFAVGRRVVCKHMVALYFTVFPDAYEGFMEEVASWEEEEKRQEEEALKELKLYVKSLSKKELQEELFQTLLELEELKKSYW